MCSSDLQQWDDHILRYGIGLVLAHTDATIGNRTRYRVDGLTGYKITGPTFQLNYERWLWENDLFFLSLDTKLTVSFANNIPVSHGNQELATANDIAIHISLGFGSKPAAFNKPGIEKAWSLAPLLYPLAVGNLVIHESMLPSD